MPSRRRSWADRTIDQTVSGGGGNGIFDLLLNAPTVDTITVARLLINLEFTAQVTAAISHTQLITVGVGVCSAESFAVGVSAMPDPTQDTEYPSRGWLYVATKMQMVKSDALGSIEKTAVFDADLGALRKIDKGILFLWLENNLAFGTSANVQVVGRTRALCLM